MTRFAKMRLMRFMRFDFENFASIATVGVGGLHQIEAIYFEVIADIGFGQRQNNGHLRHGHASPFFSALDE